MVHLMSAGRLRYLAPGRAGPEDADVPAAVRRRRRARAHRGGHEEARGRLAAAARRSSRRSSPTSARRRTSSTPETLAPILAADSRRLHSLLRDQRAIAGIGRAWANEILNAARLSPYALSTQLVDEEIERLAGRDPRRARARARAAPGAAPRTQPPTASTTGSASRARAAGRRSRGSTSRSTRSTTARTARPTAGCSRTGGMSRLLR